MKERVRKIINLVAAFFLAAFTCLPYVTAFSSKVVVAQGENTVKPLDETYIIDDLGEEVISNFGEMPGEDPKLYSFSEFSYSENALLRQKAYGVYLYVYNPSRFEYAERIGANVVNMAVAYDENGVPTSYENLPLKNCGHTTGKYDKLFYKFRVMNSGAIEENAISFQKKNGKRRYDLAGIQLLKEGAKTATEYKIAMTYHISGYGKGCGVGAENVSTLSVEWSELETIELEVKHANYRTGAYQDYVCDELNTVYFSVPERYFTDYGGLQKIKAEWYEYKTQPVFVTSDADGYEELYDFIGVNIGEHTDLSKLSYRVLWEEKGIGTLCSFNKSYNGKVEDFPVHTASGFVQYFYEDGATHLPRLNWIFNRGGISSVEEYAVSRDEVIEYMEWYTSTFVLQDTVCGKYAEGLFADSIDSDRLSLLENSLETRGYIVQEIDAGDSKDLTFYDENQSKWDKYWHGVKYKEKGYDPIIVLTSNDVAGYNADTFAEEYLIGESDKEAVFAGVKQMIQKGERAVLFRFAVTDYYASTARFDRAGDTSGLFDEDIDMSKQDGYVAQETVFLDFDIISLTFRKDGIDTVVAAVSDPIDIINGFEAPPDLTLGDEESLFEKILRIIFIIVVVVFVIWLITLLVRFLKWVWEKLFHKG